MTSSGSNTTRWATYGCRERPCGARRLSAPSRTSRSPAVTIDAALIAALGAIKAAAATVNAELGVIDADVAAAISAAATDIAAGEYDDAFPIDVYQTGSGTSSNMNTNEVIATLAAKALGRDVHPNDHVNASQSSNDVFPSAIHVAATRMIVTDLIPSLRHLDASLSRKADEWADVVKSGRTHLMDATPVTLGQEFGGYAAAIRYGVERLESSLPRIGELPLGGTAVGTGINTPAGFAAKVVSILASSMGLPLTEARNHFEAQGSRDALVEASGQLGRSPPASTSSPTTCGGCPLDRPQACPRSTCRTCSPDRRSCRARSTRSSLRRSARSSLRSTATMRLSRSAARRATSSSTSCSR